MAELISEAATDAVTAFNEQVLDMLVDTYRKLAEQDRVSGSTDEYGALGGVAMLADRAIEVGPATTTTLLGMAVRRLAKAEVRDA